MGSIAFVGMDVHKATIAVAVAEGVRGGEVRQLGIFPNRAEVIAKLAKRLAGDGRELSFCYEAGPCGYGLQRQLEGLGHACVVVAPSLIPSKPGDRVKTDRRDALSLAKLHRAGELTAVWVPDTAHEAMRDLVRARATAVRVLGKARQHLQGFLLRHGRIYAGRTTWTLAYRRWLTTLRFAHPAQQIVLQDYIHAVQDAEGRVARLAEQITDLLPSWSLAAVVQALQAMRGVGQIVAVTVAAEVGDFSRFANPRQLMAYLGLVPSERSSGGTVRRGGITIGLCPIPRRDVSGADRTLIQPPPQRVIVGRPAPAAAPLLERLGAGHRTRLALEDVEVVIEVQNLLTAAVTALMTGNTSAAVPDLEMGRVEAGLHFAAGPRRYRVGVGVHGDAAARMDQGER
jgi:transposase